MPETEQLGLGEERATRRLAERLDLVESQWGDMQYRLGCIERQLREIRGDLDELRGTEK